MSHDEQAGLESAMNLFSLASSSSMIDAGVSRSTRKATESQKLSLLCEVHRTSVNMHADGVEYADARHKG